VYTIYVRSDLLYLVSALKVIYALSVVFFKYSLGLLPSSQKFRGIVVVIANFITFASPEHPIFSLAAQMRMRYQAADQRWRDDATKEHKGAIQCCFQIYKHFRREY
jgi:hypothetical protein